MKLATTYFTISWQFLGRQPFYILGDCRFFIYKFVALMYIGAPLFQYIVLVHVTFDPVSQDHQGCVSGRSWAKL